jgi:hypothetical protein
LTGKTRHVTEGDEYPWARGLGNFRCRCDIRIANVQTPSDGILKIKPSPDAVGTGTVCSAGETIVAEDHDFTNLDFLVSRTKRGYDHIGRITRNKDNTRACVLLRRYLVMFFLVFCSCLPGRKASRGTLSSDPRRGIKRCIWIQGQMGFGDEDDPEDDHLVGPEVIGQ